MERPEKSIKFYGNLNLKILHKINIIINYSGNVLNYAHMTLHLEMSRFKRSLGALGVRSSWTSGLPHEHIRVSHRVLDLIGAADYV